MIFLPIEMGDKFTIGNSKEFYQTCGWADGEYKIAGARILGISYPSYLRFARDLYKADILNIDKKYMNIMFKTREDCQNFCNLLNQRWSEIKWQNLKQ